MADKIATFAQRLRSGLDVRQMTQSELSKLSRISKSSISRYLKGDWEGKQSAVYALSNALDVSEAWLMGYDVPMESTAPVTPAIPAGFEPLPEMSTVPLVGAIACGTPILAEQNIEARIGVPAAWRADFALTCRGDSMEPKIKDGDIVAIRTHPEVGNGEVAAVRIGEEATLKRVFLFPDHLELRAENPAFSSIILIGEDMNTVHIEGKAVGFCRGL